MHGSCAKSGHLVGASVAICHPQAGPAFQEARQEFTGDARYRFCHGQGGRVHRWRLLAWMAFPPLEGDGITILARENLPKPGSGSSEPTKIAGGRVESAADLAAQYRKRPFKVRIEDRIAVGDTVGQGLQWAQVLDA